MGSARVGIRRRAVVRGESGEPSRRIASLPAARASCRSSAAAGSCPGRSAGCAGSSGRSSAATTTRRSTASARRRAPAPPRASVVTATGRGRDARGQRRAERKERGATQTGPGQEHAARVERECCRAKRAAGFVPTHVTPAFGTGQEIGHVSRVLISELLSSLTARELCQERGSVAHLELARSFEVELLHDPVLHEHREPLHAWPHPELREIDIQAELLGELPGTITQHTDLANRVLVTSPRRHDVAVVDRYAPHFIDPHCPKLVEVLDISREVLGGTRRSECAGHSKDRDSLALGRFRHGNALGGQRAGITELGGLGQSGIRKGITDLDRHGRDRSTTHRRASAHANAIPTTSDRPLTIGKQGKRKRLQRRICEEASSCARRIAKVHGELHAFPSGDCITERTHVTVDSSVQNAALVRLANSDWSARSAEGRGLLQSDRAFPLGANPHRREQLDRIRLAVLTLVALCLSSGCGDSDKNASTRSVCDIPLSATVPAPEWVRQRSGVFEYRYRAPVDLPQVDVELRGEGKKLLGTLAAEQLYGDATYPDGALRGILHQDGQPDITLVTTGALTFRGYEVRAELRQADTVLEITAAFALGSCFSADAGALKCAGALPIDQPAYTLPSCGLLFDNAVLANSAPELERLTYRAPANGRALDVVVEGVTTPAEEVITWAQAAAVDPLLGSTAERILTSVFADRTWWRELERHVSHCLGDTTTPEPPATTTGQSKQTLCKGSAAKPVASDWTNTDTSSGSASEEGGFWGDPHVTSLDGNVFDFQGAGEYVLVRSVSGPPLELQARFEPWDSKSGLGVCKEISVGTAIALQSGAQRITASARPSFQARLDGQPLVAGVGLSLADGGEVVISKTSLRIDWPDGQHILFSGTAGPNPLRVRLSPSRAGTVRGLLGQFDGNPENDLVAADGTLLPEPVPFDDLYQVFGESWRVTSATTLFDYEPGEDTSTFTKPGFPSQPAKIEDLPEPERSTAQAECEVAGVLDPSLLSSCILDSICLSEPAGDAAARQPGPLAALPDAFAGVWSAGSVRYSPLPEVIDLSALPPPDASGVCKPVPAPWIMLYAESATTLGSPLGLDASGSVVLDGTGSPAPTTVPAGTSVRSFLFGRRPSDGGPPLIGRVRFDSPILGVIVSDAALTASAGALAAPNVQYPKAPQGLELGEDRIELGADGYSANIVLTGADADQLRIVTEAP